MSELIIRPGQEKDVSGLLALIVELAIYEKEPEAVVVTEEMLLQDCFGEKAVANFLVAEKDQMVVGIALYYPKYSTWKGRCLFLEDLVVSEKHRRQGIGEALFDELMALAGREKAMRLEWQVLDWNEPAIKFYKKLNAQLDSEWINCKFDKDQLEKYQR